MLASVRSSIFLSSSRTQRSSGLRKRTYVSESSQAMSEISQLFKKQTEVNRKPIAQIFEELDSIKDLNQKHAKLTELMSQEITRFRDSRIKLDAKEAKSQGLTEIQAIEDEMESFFNKQQVRVEKMDALLNSEVKPVDWTEMKNRYYHPWNNVEFVKKVTEEEDAVKKAQVDTVLASFEKGDKAFLQWATEKEESDRVTKRVADDIIKKVEKKFEEVEDLEQGFHLFTVDDLANKFPALDTQIDEELREWQFVVPNKLGSVDDEE
eukprot:TRINITY_DN7969_c0_g1_i1.p1 TRINITY_DN7969_c0_g1~~TRINITY_DN7969_c0_g1_i1.p1  ORF type:complete len:265 (-),score=89.72 TRINITY_DN7969_c0_g1_i1:47-841(-)